MQNEKPETVTDAAARTQSRSDVPVPSVGKGAPPSNTAPTNDILDTNEITILRYAVDSLYLSYQGELSTDWAMRLDNIKDKAQSLDPRVQAEGQLKLLDHIFEMKPRGRGKFNYVLVDGWYQIQLAGKNASSLPMAYVQLGSELLTLIGPEQAAKNLLPIINTFGDHQEPNVSRIDLCVDFVSPIAMDSWTHDAWVTRAHNIDPHYVKGQFSGWSIGQGGNIVARLYNKTLELQKSKKDYLRPIWESAGWNGTDDIWRLEFQIRGGHILHTTLKQLPVMLSLLGSYWSYCCNDWCRLTIPNSNDSRRSRWPTHPMWESLSQVEWGSLEVVPLMRPRKDRPPSDEALFINGLGAITSFMAREGIEDWSEGFGEYIAQAKAFHDDRCKMPFSAYISRKRKEKERRFNTRHNNESNGQSIVERLDQAEAYRKAKDGE